ncbi:MAG: TonB-dependent receptor [Bacteroidales bacterium]|nr:TonB-dependent receptor [Bacteroidales bacterium]
MKKSFIVLLLCLTGISSNLLAQTFTMSGYVKDASNGEELIGATVYVEEIKSGTVSNSYGFYSLSLKQGKYHIKLAYLGYRPIDYVLDLTENISKNFQLTSDDKLLNDVDIFAEKKDQNIKSVEMSVNKLQMKNIMKIPALMGEVDVLRTIQMLPGVQTVGEGSVGFYVRGGGADQNLVLLDEATVYNASHLGGLFSVFNQDIVKDLDLYKGGIPSPFGGRLSSILDIRMKEGNKKRFNATGGIGLISSRLTLEGPIIKDKASFIISGRRTYADLFFPLLNDSVIKKSKAFFYDFNAKANYQINEKNRVFISGYFGRDLVQFGDAIRINYGNETLTTRFNHLFNPKLFSNLTFIYSVFDYGMGVPQGSQGFDWKSGIDDISFKNDYTWFPNTKNTIEFGGQITYHTFRPGAASPIGDESIFTGTYLPYSYAFEYGAFIENNHKITNKLTMRYGLRFSAFQNKGEYTDYIYDKSDEKNYVVTDSVIYKKGALFNANTAFEPRLSIKYELDNFSSIKLSYNRMVQYIHLTTNTMSTTPLDLWFPSSPNVEPEKADQIAIGYFRNFNDNEYELSVESYYKKMYNSIDYKDHAEVLLNKYLEGELRIGSSYSYGLEVLLKKQTGKFTGWLSYTFARVFREISEINDGKKYPANYDKPHDISLILSYDLNERLNLSLTWLYSTGAPRTMPTGRYEAGNMIIPIYSERNGVRLPDYHRMDLGLTYQFKKFKANGEPKKYQSNINLSIYNAYNRHNAYSIVFNQKENNWYTTESIKTYLFKIFPSITYNFHF